MHVNNPISGTLTVPFTAINVNVGLTASQLPYDVATNTVTILISGVYYMELVAHKYYGNIDMRLTLSGSGTVLTRLYAAFATSFVTRSRSVISSLNAGDVLYVQGVNVGMSGGSYQGISFQGILLYKF